MIDIVEFLSSESENEFDEQDFIIQNESMASNDNEYGTNNIRAQKSQTAVRQNKQSLISQIRQLKTHIIMLERECLSVLNSKNKKGKQEYEEILETANKLRQERKQEFEGLKNNLNRTAAKLEKFQRDKLLAQKNALGLEKLKVLMEDIEENIMQLKQKQKQIYEDFMSSESTLTGEIEKFTKKFNAWSTLKSQSNYAVDNVKTSERDEERKRFTPKEVDAFENFLQVSGGHYGGWDEYDHHTFLKLYKKYSKRDQFITAATSDIPTHGSDEIADHFDWYKEYTTLRELKREAIRNWKKMKSDEKEAILSNIDKSTIHTENKKKQKLQEICEKERQERLHRLQSWKAQKEQCEQIDEKAEQDKQQQLKVKQLMEEKRRLETKIQIQEYRVRKKEEEEVLRMAKEQHEKQQIFELSDVEKSRIQERNTKMLEQKRIQQEKKLSEREQKEERLKKLKGKVLVNVDRDPSRLYKPTEGWKQRQKQEKEKSSVLTVGTRALPHRAVPSWRQGIS